MVLSFATQQESVQQSSNYAQILSPSSGVLPFSSCLLFAALCSGAFNDALLHEALISHLGSAQFNIPPPVTKTRLCCSVNAFNLITSLLRCY